MRANIYYMGRRGDTGALAACNNAKSPDTAAKDIAAADQSAAARSCATHSATQQKDMSADAYNVAVAQADGDHKVALQKCETLQGHDQQLCKDQGGRRL